MSNVSSLIGGLFSRLAGQKKTEIGSSKNMSENHSRRFSMDEIRKATDNFNESKIIGAGGFGMVYKGVINDESIRTLVAVKRTLDPESKQGIQGLETEIKMLSKCRHSNLVTLLGYCNENQEMILVYEYMSRGNLADHLYGNRGAFLTWEQRLKICIGAARGLDYLHTGTGLSERIVHLDIKSDNILLDDSLAAKVADLGLSQVGPANQQNTQVNTGTLRGTQGYVDPEYSRTFTYSSKSDVYSFGVVLLEVLSGTSVWGGQIIPKSERADWIQQHISNHTLNQIVDPRIASEIQPGSLKRFVYTASNMLQLDSMKRPSMSSVVAQLESALTLQSSSPTVDNDHPFEVGFGGQTSRLNDEPEWLDKQLNVFGEPIGDNAAVKMGLYPTRANRALAAFLTHDQDKLQKAADFLEDLKAQWGSVMTTCCLIYNATGETLTYVTSRNRYGDTSPSSYPMKIHNGQYGAYMHRKTSIMPTGSVGAVVYRGRYSDNAFCDHMITWSNRTIHANAAYGEINEVGHFGVANWDVIFKKAKFAGLENDVTWKDCCETRVAIEGKFSSLFTAVFTQVGIYNKYKEFMETLSVNVPLDL